MNAEHMVHDRGLGELDEDALEECDGYVVLIVDPATGARDTYGPFGHAAAMLEAARHERELRGEGLTDVEVVIVRHHQRPERP